MSDIFQQLSELVLGSVPTMVLFLILATAYNFLLHRPLTRTLAERREKTQGAVEKATAAIAAAEAKTIEYETKLRTARGKIFQARDQRMQQWNAEREALLTETRTEAQGKIETERQKVEKSVSAAKLEIVTVSEQLAEQVIQAVLPTGARRQPEGAQ